MENQRSHTRINIVAALVAGGAAGVCINLWSHRAPAIATALTLDRFVLRDIIWASYLLGILVGLFALQLRTNKWSLRLTALALPFVFVTAEAWIRGWDSKAFTGLWSQAWAVTAMLLVAVLAGGATAYLARLAGKLVSRDR